jgi:tRNA modification GTPase
MQTQETIAAIATPPGEGGIGIVRISGPQAAVIGSKLLKDIKNRPFTAFQDRRIFHGRVTDPLSGRVLDDALFFLAQSPHSYTGEETLEIQAHGGPQILRSILDAALAAGARLAEPGEFTKRAFLNGRIDLIQAEAVIDLIRARTAEAQQLALNQLAGRASTELAGVENRIYHWLASIEATLDFPEDGIPELARNELTAELPDLIGRLEDLLAGSDQGRRIREGLLIVIAGRPNVGKSSLLNAFLAEDRAIVTEIPGTTRDLLEVELQWDGVPVRLVDTAGLRETSNPVEQIGIAKARAALAEADLILLVFDGSQALTGADRKLIRGFTGRPVLLIINKSDLPQKTGTADFAEFDVLRIMEISLLNSDGVQAIETVVRELVGLGQLQVSDTPLLSRLRHKQALDEALRALKAFRAGLEDGSSEELLAIELRAAAAALGSLTGKQVTSEVLEAIFTRFCIGK